MRTAVACVILSLPLPRVAAQVVTEMTPDRIREAIAYGREAAAKARSGEGRAFLMSEEQAFRVRFGSSALPGARAFGWNPESLVITTPFLRVALAAADAASKRLPFGPDQVTAETLAPILEVYQPGFVLGRTAVNYKHLLVARGEGDRAEIIQPVEIEVTTERWQNAFGATTETHGVRAIFPLSVLQEGNEFRLIRENGVETAEAITAKRLAEIR